MDNYVSKDAISKWQHNCKLKMYTSKLFLEFYSLKLEHFWPLLHITQHFSFTYKICYMSCQKYSTHTYFAFQSKQAAQVFLLGSAIFSNFYEQFHAQRACHGVSFFSSFFFRKIVSSNLKYKNSQRRTRRLCVILEFQICPYT